MDMGRPRPVFFNSCTAKNPRTRVMASLDRIRALVAFRPMRATKMGISIFIFSFIRTKTGNSSFFFNSPRAVEGVRDTN